ncbi:SNF2-related protein [Limibacter armeniacum]|uniref:SNF2-related protein n=1 Tax=Limibacter armeniacum TaxID=466084 RepID=UPI002FE60769
MIKRYRGQLAPHIQQLIRTHQKSLEALIASVDGLGNAPAGDFDTTVQRLNKGITEDEIKAWVWYKRQQNVPMTNWLQSQKYLLKGTEKDLQQLVKRKALYVTEKGYVPYAVFTYGNMYDRLKEVEALQETIVKQFGEVIYQHHLEVIQKNTPKRLTITNPQASERPKILSISQFALNFKVSTLRDETGVILEEERTLQEAYSSWLYAIDSNEIKGGISANDIVNYYLLSNPKPRYVDKEAWKSIKKLTRDEGERLFSEFLYRALEISDQQKIDIHWNRLYNGHSDVNYQKVPIALDVSPTFHGFPFELRKAQREGVAFMEMTGSGIIAYDVGVGKTITAISELASAIQSGKCKRPLVVVPNPTYSNWIAEMVGKHEGGEQLNGILTGTGITINEWYNLGAGIEKSIDLNKVLPAKSITLVTYEGFKKLGFGDNVEMQFINELSNILDQEDFSERAKEKANEKYREKIGVGQSGTIADVETLGFDYIVIDEAHNMKNIFTSVKGRSEEEDGKSVKRFHLQNGSEPSFQGLKAFFICNYIQRKFGRNVMLLTATPFSNSPLEVYSMLSLVAREQLVQMDLFNINDFFETFVLETTEYAVGADGRIVEKNVVRSFNNRLVLQKLLYNHINYKTGEEAGVPRPCKINLPKVSEVRNGELVRLPVKEQTLTYLQMTPEQKEIQDKLSEQASKGASRNDPGRLLRIMNDSLNNALSPYIYKGSAPKSYMDFVESSPKIKYSLDCIQSVKQYHEKRGEAVSGQVLYIDRGKDYFPFIKQYLEEKVGFKRNITTKFNPRQKVDEVEIISGGISQTNKEKIKNAFLEGTCKVLIGTSTIKEGINLQKKGTVIYNCYPNWNPTDIRQLEGRIWRQKNEFGFVRIVMPLVENSMDVFVFQKLDEKSARINDLWYRSDRGNVLDEESLDTNEVKYALISDEKVLAEHDIKIEYKEIIGLRSQVQSNIELLEEFQSIKSNYHHYRDEVLKEIRTRFERLESYDFIRNKPSEEEIKKRFDTKKLQDEARKGIALHEETLEKVIKSSSINDKDIIRIRTIFSRLYKEFYGGLKVEKFKEALKKYNKIISQILTPKGLTPEDNIQGLIDELKREYQAIEKDRQRIQSDNYFLEVARRIAQKKKEMAVSGASIEQRVKEFKNLNYLLSYQFKDIDHTHCVIPKTENKPNSRPKEEATELALIEVEALALELELALLEI